MPKMPPAPSRKAACPESGYEVFQFVNHSRDDLFAHTLPRGISRHFFVFLTGNHRVFALNLSVSIAPPTPKAVQAKKAEK